MNPLLPPFPGDDEGRWRTLSSTYLFQRPWLTVRCQRMLLPTGREHPEYYILEYPTWVNIIALTPDDRMLLVRQYRPALDIMRYELCAGVMDPSDASPLEAAQHELLEETGFGGGEWTKLMVVGPNPSAMNNVSISFLAHGVTKLCEPRLEETEDISVHLFSRDEVYNMLKVGQFAQALMVAPLWRYFAEHPCGS
ncbi:MAG: NUDIX hydrolase [Alloprevotella sp.]